MSRTYKGAERAEKLTKGTNAHRVKMREALATQAQLEAEACEASHLTRIFAALMEG